MVATRFAVAVHLMMLLAGAGRGRAFGCRAAGQALPATSGRLASIVNTNPVVVRRIAGQLSRAGLIRVHRGPGGAELARAAEAITLEDIWLAVHAANRRPLVPLHAPATGVASGTATVGADQPDAGVPVHAVLAAVFADAEASFRAALGRVTLGAIVRRSGPAGAALIHAGLMPGLVPELAPD